jgi:hypothetical protein
MINALVLGFMGAFLVFIGGLAIRQKKIHFRRRNIEVHGVPAMVLGGILAALGIGCVLAGIYSLTL